MKDFVLRSLRAVFEFFIARPAQGAVEIVEGVGTIVPELVHAAGSAIAANLSWAGKVRIALGIEKVQRGAGKMVPALCALFAAWLLTPAWPLILYLIVLFLVLDLPVTASTSRDDGAAKVVG